MSAVVCISLANKGRMSLSTDWLMLWATDVYWNCRRPATGGLPTFWKLSIDLCICSHNRACGRNEDLFLTLYALSLAQLTAQNLCLFLTSPLQNTWKQLEWYLQFSIWNQCKGDTAEEMRNYTWTSKLLTKQLFHHI